MKIIIKTVIFLFILIISTRTLFSEDFWEPIICPPDAPVGTVILGNQGNIYTIASQAIYKSSNEGKNWNLIKSHNFVDYPQGLAINSSGDIYTLSSNSLSVSTIYLYKSSNQGDSWSEFEIGIDNAYDILDFKTHKDNCIYLLKSSLIKKVSFNINNEIKVEEIRPSSVSVQYKLITTSGDSNIYVTSNESIFHSSDFGENWEKFEYKFTSNSSLKVVILDNGTICAISDNGKVWSSNDNGKSFKSFNQDFNAVKIRALIMNKNNEILAFCPDGIFKTSNEGESWDYINDSFVYITSNNRLLKDADCVLYAGTANGFYVSYDNGINWLLRTDGIKSKPTNLIDTYNKVNKIIVSSSNRLININIETQSYEYLNIDFISGYIKLLKVDKNDVLFAVDVFSYLHRSTDYGKSWVKLSYFKDLGIRKISCGENNEVFIVAYDLGGLYKSTDLGDSWILSNIGIENYEIDSPTYIKDNIMLIPIINNGIFKSTNKGDSWFKTNFDLNLTAGNITFDNNYNIYAAYGSYLYKSTDLGDNWFIANDQLPSFFLITEMDEFFSFPRVYGKNCYINKNLNEPWELLNSGISHTTGDNFVIGSDGRIYLTTNSWVYRSIEPVNSVENSSKISDNNEISIFPNPLSNSGAIKYNLKEPGAVEIKLYDVLGNHLQTLFSGYRDAGFVSIDFSVEAMPIGIYYIVFKHNNNVIVEKFVKI